MKLYLPTFLIFFIFNGHVLASQPCFIVRDFPSVSKIVVKEDKLNVFINNTKSIRRPKSYGDLIEFRYDQNDNGYLFTKDRNSNWSSGKIVSIKNHQGLRDKGVRNKGLSKQCKKVNERLRREDKFNFEDAEKLDPKFIKRIKNNKSDYYLNQNITDCFETESEIIGSLGYYRGEGAVGYGGIVRINKETNKLEVFRNLELSRANFTSVTVIDDLVLLGTAGNYECTGSPPDKGLLILNLETNKVTKLHERNICGSVIHDVNVWDDTIWVGTEMGLSSAVIPEDVFDIDLNRLKWKNYIPTADGSGLKEVKSCINFYFDLIDQIPEPGHSDFWFETSFDYLFQVVARKYNLDHFIAEYIYRKRGFKYSSHYQ